VKTLSDLGERKAIQRIVETVTKGDVAVGIGDDCAAIQIRDEYILVTTDMITKKTHIPKGMSPFQIGWFVIAINLSDIAAKGGEPLGVVLSLGLPRNTKEGFLKQLMKGADQCATRFGTSIIGGDTKENPELTLCGTAIGMVKKKEFMPRKGMKPWDIVTVTGSLGKAAAGYLALQHRMKEKEMTAGLFEPVPRIPEGRALAQKKIVSSCMDISDGLSSSLYQLQDVNHMGFVIEKEKIPLSPALKRFGFEKDIVEYGLHFGGDYELLVILPFSKVRIARQVVKKAGGMLTVIGHVTKQKEIVLLSGKKKTLLKNKGYEHFKPHHF
jgi:thiamine-monophosphate kinase